MLKDLQEQLTQISLESATISTEGDLQGKLSGYLTGVTDFLKKGVVNPIARFFARKDLQAAGKAAEKYNYADLRPVLVRIPVGLKTDLVTYVTALLDAADSVSKMREQVILPFKTWLSQKLGNPASLAALSNSLQIGDYKPAKLDQIEESISKYISGTQATTPYSVAFKRNADWGKLDDLIAKLNAYFTPEMDAALKADVDQINELVLQLIKRYKEDPTNYKMSPKVIEALSQTCFEVARHVEYYGALRMRVVEVNEALESTAAKIGTMQNQ